jgi:predicted site-specific integrase-resolvase
MNYDAVLPDEMWESPGAAARRVSVTTKTLQRWYEAGLITAIILPSRHKRYLRSDIDAILEERKAS